MIGARGRVRGLACARALVCVCVRVCVCVCVCLGRFERTWGYTAAGRLPRRCFRFEGAHKRRPVCPNHIFLRRRPKGAGGCFRFEGDHKPRPVGRHRCGATRCYSQAQGEGPLQLKYSSRLNTATHIVLNNMSWRGACRAPPVMRARAEPVPRARALPPRIRVTAPPPYPCRRASPYPSRRASPYPSRRTSPVSESPRLPRI